MAFWWISFAMAGLGALRGIPSLCMLRDGETWLLDPLGVEIPNQHPKPLEPYASIRKGWRKKNPSCGFRYFSDWWCISLPIFLAHDQSTRIKLSTFAYRWFFFFFAHVDMWKMCKRTSFHQVEVNNHLNGDSGFGLRCAFIQIIYILCIEKRTDAAAVEV